MSVSVAWNRGAAYLLAVEVVVEFCVSLLARG